MLRKLLGLIEFNFTVDINHLREVRSGYSTDTFNVREKSPKFREKYPEDRCFSLVLKNGKVYNLIAADKFIKNNWVDVLSQLIDRTHKADRDARIRR